MSNTLSVRTLCVGMTSAVLSAVCASALAAGTDARAAEPTEPAVVPAPVGINALPAAWADFGQQIYNFQSGRCVQPEATSAGARVVQRTCVLTSSQQRWKVVDAGDGHAMLVNQANRTLCLDLFANSDAEVVVGTPIQVFTCGAFNTEHFSRSAGSRSQHFQVPTHIRPSLCLDIRGGSTADGAPLQLAACDFLQPTQQFKFVDAR